MPLECLDVYVISGLSLHGCAVFISGEPGPLNDEGKMGAEEKADSLVVNDVAELLEAQYAINAGGKSKEGCPVIIFPDNLNFHLLSDVEYQRLMLYLTSVSS